MDYTERQLHEQDRWYLYEVLVEEFGVDPQEIEWASEPEMVDLILTMQEEERFNRLGNTIKITQSHKWYVVETKHGRSYMLTEKSLKWNLKHHFKLSAHRQKKVMTELKEVGRTEVAA